MRDFIRLYRAYRHMWPGEPRSYHLRLAWSIARTRLAWWSQFENYEQAQCAYKKDKKRQTTEDEAIIEQLPLAGEWS
jgi:transposase